MFKLNLYYLWCFYLFLISIFFLFLGFFFLFSGGLFFFEWVFISFSSVSVCCMIYLDWISSFFCFVVLFISSMVLLYSSVYMGDYNYGSKRFFFLVLLFIFSMLLMILSPNLISIMLGWDGLGLVSYCLIVYYMSFDSYLAGMLTCLINRLGDIGLLICISWVFSFGSWNVVFYNEFFSSLVFYLVIISSFTSSAQIPFAVWLPAAMAAPTPVSSLVHSSTLVTAGLYLMIRFNGVLYFDSFLPLFISLLTMLMASFCSLYEFDLSKIIALSTLGQLGLMMSCLFMGFLNLSFFHLLTHAMFKSLLFLCSGVMIHLMNGNQDIRSMGSLSLVAPYTCSCFNISNMSLFGVPFLSGFYSSDLIVESMSFLGFNFFVVLVFYFSLGLTSFYSFRLFYYTLLLGYSGSYFSNLGEGGIYIMKYSILFLTFFSVCFGCLFMWLLNFDFSCLFFPFYLKLVSFFFIFLGLLFGLEFSDLGLLFFFRYGYNLNSTMWFMFSYFNYLCNFFFFINSRVCIGVFWGEYYGSLGVLHYILSFTNFFQFYMMASFGGFLTSLTIWMVLFI